MTTLDIGLLSVTVSETYVPFPDSVLGRRLIVYGAGGLYDSFATFVLSRFGVTPNLIIDKKYIEGANFGHSSPDHFFEEGWTQVSKNDLIVICLGNDQLFSGIKQQFISLGFEDVRSAYDIYEYNLIYADEEFARNPVTLYRKEWAKLAHVYALLQDALSRDTYYKYLRTHIERLRPHFAPASYPYQYTPSDLPLIREGIRLLNCGAYTGDTIENFIRNYGSVEFVCALEPDSENFEKLSKNTVIRDGCAATILLPLGASNQNSTCLFESGNGMISRVSESSNEKTSIVQIVKLDTILNGLNFNKVVIDTEGHEMAILDGMRQIIRASSPDLCVACYHYPEDIFQIALLIESIQPKYKFYLRNYSSVCVDTVLYATLQ